MVDPQDLINGAPDIAPISAPPSPPTRDATRSAPATSGASTQAILMAWFALVILLVMAHVITLQVQV